LKACIDWSPAKRIFLEREKQQLFKKD